MAEEFVVPVRFDARSFPQPGVINKMTHKNLCIPN